MHALFTNSASGGLCKLNAQKPPEDRYRAIADLLRFTETVSAKLQGLPDEATVYRTVIEEFRTSEQEVSILLLVDERTALRVACTSLSPERLHALTEIMRHAQPPLPTSPQRTPASHTLLTDYAINLSGSAVFQQIAFGGWTLHALGREMLRDVLPSPLPDLIVESMGYQKSWFVLTPLSQRGRIVAILAAAAHDETGYWVDSIKLLGQRISDALERVDAETRRRDLDQELWRTEERFRALIERTSDCIMVLDRDGIVGYASPSSERLLGCEHEWCIGKNLLALVCPEDVPRARADFVRVLKNPQAALSGDLRFQHQDGSQRVCEITATNLLDDPAVGGIVLNAHDITKRRQAEEALQASEQRFRSMAEAVPVGFWMLTPDWGQMLYVSPAAAKISGRTCEDLCKQPDLWRRNIHADDHRRVVSFATEHHGQPFEVEYRIVRPDGEVRWIRQVTAPIRNESGELTVVTGIMEDITERKRAEAQLLQAAKLASLGVLAGGIAHELRNPLAIISVNIELLTQHSNDARVLRQCVRRIQAATERSSHIIENLLSFASPRRASMAPVELSLTLEDTLVLLHEHIALQGIKLRKYIRPGLPKVQGNAGLLQLVFTNLIMNACNVMPPGGTLVVSMRPDGAGWAKIEFRDNGHGIPPERLPEIFDPFITSEPNGRGTGLGLAVSRTIIRQHQGSIDVQSQVGQGTTFTIRLPAAPCVTLPQGASAEASE